MTSTCAVIAGAPGIELQPVPRIEGLDRDAFFRDFQRPARPVVLTGLARDWPALAKWTPQYLAQRYGAQPVPVYDARFVARGANYMSSVATMTFGDFLRAVLSEERDLRMFLYNIASEIPELRADVPLPDLADGFSRRFVFTFFGCRGSVTPLHYDIDNSHVLHTCLYGRRRIVLFAPDQGANLYRHPFTVRSYVDVERPDYGRYPRLARAQGYDVTLRPGETLFMPSGYWHEVRYLDGGYGLSLRFPSERPGARLRGLVNLALVSPLDRLLNKLAPDAWFAWKARAAQRADRRGEA